jgi:uncharacterized protein (DUF1800 family)
MRFLGIVLIAACPAFGQSTSQQMSASAAARFLDQATWGPTPGSIAQLQQMGIANWLNAQFALNTSNILDQPQLASTGEPNRDIHPVQAAFFQNTVTGQDQLRQRVAFALSQMWVVSFTGVPIAYAFPPYWRIFRDHAFGNYRDLIQAVTLSPAMGRYLNVANNNKANPAKNTSANENYARELMQLFTLGLTQLNPNGTPLLDQNNNPIPTYDQNVVTNIAKVLTGWTYPTAPGARQKNNNPQYFLGQMFAVESEHDTSAKTIFGNITIPAGQTAEQDLGSLLDALMAQPTMAPFVSEQLIQHLVTSNPSPEYIQRVAAVFDNNGSNVRGDMKAVITAILMDQEARRGDDPATAVGTDGHLQEPILYMTGLLRMFNATTLASSLPYQGSTMGENVLDTPSVFNFFSPSYVIPQTNSYGPEFQILTTSTALYRANWTNNFVFNTIAGDTTVDYTSWAQQASNPSAMLDSLNTLMLHGTMSSDMKTSILTAMQGVYGGSTNPMGQAQAAIYLIATSSQYQIAR